MDKTIINIVYSKCSKISECLINEIYKHFTYNLDEKFSINLGYTICLYEISEDLPQNFHHNALTIFLISEHFFVNTEKITKIAKECSNDTILPIGLCESAHRLFEKINIVKLNHKQIEKEKYKLLCIIAQKFINKSVHVFLSYYRTESENFCRKIQNIISSIPDFNGFVDTTDISYGKDIQTEIDSSLNDGLLMCISTDKYSERIWCAHELIYAKEKDIPIIILDCLSNCETRRSPYSGNVPVYKIGSVSEESVTTALFLLLKEKLRKDINKKTTDKNEVYYLWKAPELSRIMQIKNDNNKVSNCRRSM